MADRRHGDHGGYGSDRDRRDDRDRREREDRERDWARVCGGGGGQPRRPSGGLPPRGPSNPLIAEAYRLAREKKQAEERERGRASDADSSPEPERPPSRGWRASLEDEGEMPEDGELPAAGPAAQQEAEHDDERSPGKRKHAPIVWHTPPKQARGELPHVGSLKGALDALDGAAGAAGTAGAAGAAGAAPKTAAERALEEVAAFAAAQAGSGDEADDAHDGPVMKDSPMVSGSEGEDELAQKMAAAAQRSASLSPQKQGAGEGADGADTAPSAQPKRASRWMQEAEEEAAKEAAREAAARGGGPAADAESERSDEEGRGGGEGHNPDELSPGRPAKRAVSMLSECRSVDTYEKLNRISEGTYGVVYRARDRDTGEICALKKVKLEKERDGFPLTSIREINILLSLNHPHIVNVSEVVVGPSLDAVFMVMEYADHDLKAVMEERMTQPFSVAEVKTLMRQLLGGMAYLHENWVLHRDLKTSNILYTNKGELKLCDFGLARQYGSPLAPYTHMVVTLWYRAPELLLGARKYSTAVDVWSIGCIMAELLSKEALFSGKSEIDQLQLILKTMGSPTEETWPGVSQLPNARKFNLGKYPCGSLRQRFPASGLGFGGRPPLSEKGFDLLSRLLELCPERRISCEDALEHPWFSDHPLPKDRALMPTFPATNDATQQRYAAARRASTKAG
ncbi:cyclin-dependent kinase G-2-like isoform X1 [Micractinium conductrix]|uniref:Cyclin-dependent kinase G-2-like isoform X1 n=1 Tax=Micractinium conductrix TaxID=554055 RepID=A0A2P6VJN0_9CHLO|nr:cyclin-dependent kinase G-2-like isoform X1 [Micractinium conductrix]|eukprot:PSC74284.1 cyclin-dependent kinase G-2-like isoform X1 [Micractinium conductrix]